MSDIPKLPVCFVENDERPDLVATLSGVDLSLFTVTLHVKRPSPAAVLVKPAIGIDFTIGHFKFEWATGDLVAGFNQECEIQFIDGASKPLTSRKFLIDVRKEIA